MLQGNLKGLSWLISRGSRSPAFARLRSDLFPSVSVQPSPFWAPKYRLIISSLIPIPSGRTLWFLR